MAGENVPAPIAEYEAAGENSSGYRTPRRPWRTVAAALHVAATRRLRGRRIDDAIHRRHRICGKAAAFRVLGRSVDAVHLVAAHVALYPLDRRALALHVL